MEINNRKVFKKNSFWLGKEEKVVWGTEADYLNSWSGSNFVEFIGY